MPMSINLSQYYYKAVAMSPAERMLADAIRTYNRPYRESAALILNVDAKGKETGKAEYRVVILGNHKAELIKKMSALFLRLSGAWM